MRQGRIKIEGERAAYHCMTKIVGGAFLLGEREKEVLRKQLWKIAGFCGVEILTYCLMDNHFHVLLRTPHESDIKNLSDTDLLKRTAYIYPKDKVEFFSEMLTSEDMHVRESYRANLKSRMGDVSQFMKILKQRFSIWYNKSHNRTGTLWAERFKSLLVEDNSFALSTVAAYIDLNPVRAGIVSDPSMYRYSCYGEAMGGAKQARKAIRSLFNIGLSWNRAIEKYRVIVFGKGEHYNASRPESSIEANKARDIMNSGGKVSREEALRCRVRYFTDGAVLGSREFVQSYFESHRETFGTKRRDGPREMRGSDWGDLKCIRGLRREVFG